MRILFCSSAPLSKELGASKVVIELAEEMERLGWNCTLVSPHDIAPNLDGTYKYSEHLRRYLTQHATKFDVVEYDHGHLPYARSEFPQTAMFVARSVLLAHHFKRISIPQDTSIKGQFRSRLFERNEPARRHLRIEQAAITVNEADLVNVVNVDDRTELIRCGVPEEKIVVIPYGISRRRRIQFDSLPDEFPREPLVVFVGTFDNRKGALDFPQIVNAISSAVPNVRFRLLGTLTEPNAVRRRFPRRLRSRIEVVPRFEPDSLPGLLSAGSVGIFPSYLESFGLGILEMLTASIPVIAYNCPGPPAMLSSDYLVNPGDWSLLSRKVITLLRDKEALTSARSWARQRSQFFCWQSIAQTTSELYLKHWNQQQCQGRSRVSHEYQ